MCRFKARLNVAEKLVFTDYFYEDFVPLEIFQDGVVGVVLLFPVTLHLPLNTQQGILFA